MCAVTLFTQPTCHPCKAVKARLEAYGIPFDIVDVTETPDALAEITGQGFQQTPVLRHGATYYETPQKILDFIKAWGK